MIISCLLILPPLVSSLTKFFSLANSIKGVDFKYKNLTVDDIKYKLQIWDTAGQEKYRAIVQTYYKGAMGIILLYSVEDAKSFHNIENWMKQIAAATDNDTVVLLVGNKADVEEREVLKEDGEKLAKDYNITFFETSALTGQNVREVFYQITREIKKKVGDNPIVTNPRKTLEPENMKRNSGSGNAGNNIKLNAEDVNADSQKKANCKC